MYNKFCVNANVLLLIKHCKNELLDVALKQMQNKLCYVSVFNAIKKINVRIEKKKKPRKKPKKIIYF